MTNTWWRSLVLLSQSLRVFYNMIEVVGYAYNKSKTGRIMASARTASTLYDMGDDIGTMGRYIFDFHQVESIDIGDWD